MHPPQDNGVPRDAALELLHLPGGGRSTLPVRKRSPLERLEAWIVARALLLLAVAFVVCLVATGFDFGGAFAMCMRVGVLVIAFHFAGEVAAAGNTHPLALYAKALVIVVVIAWIFSYAANDEAEEQRRAFAGGCMLLGIASCMGLKWGLWKRAQLKRWADQVQRAYRSASSTDGR